MDPLDAEGGREDQERKICVIPEAVLGFSSPPPCAPLPYNFARGGSFIFSLPSTNTLEHQVTKLPYAFKRVLSYMTPQ
jgi:hypothetical protein